MVMNKKKIVAAAAIVIGVLIILLMVFIFWPDKDPIETAPPGEQTQLPEERQPGTPPEGMEDSPGAEPGDEPSEVRRFVLERSDAFVRKMAAELSQNPRWLKWIATEDITERFVAAVDLVSRGKSPAQVLPFLQPEEPFEPIEREGQLYLPAREEDRYDQFMAVFESLNTPEAVETYEDLYPLFQETYEKIGYPEGDFNAAVKNSILELLRAPVLTEPVPVRQKVVTYSFLDPALEERSQAQKFVMRMSEQNARRFQAKLREVALALEISPDELPNPSTYPPSEE